MTVDPNAVFSTALYEIHMGINRRADSSACDQAWHLMAQNQAGVPLTGLTLQQRVADRLAGIEEMEEL